MRTESQLEADKGKETQRQVEAKEKKADQADSAVKASAHLREIAEKKLASARTSAIEESERMATDAEQTVGEALSALRTLLRARTLE